MLTDEQKTEIQNLQNNSARIAKLAEIALRNLSACDPDASKRAGEIKNEIEKLYPEIFEQISDGTFYVYMSQAPAYSNSIISRGVWRGYYYQEMPNVADEALHDAELGGDEGEVANCESRTYVAREQKLYEPVKDWLKANGFKAQVVASGRQLGPWGNPDVVGIQVTDVLGHVNISMVSVETKIQSKNWQRDIFQSISHKRYFDRCYFCFPVLADNRAIEEEMKDCAEIYGIGIVLIEMPENELRKLSQAQNAELNLEQLSITEVCPAPYSPVSAKYRQAALKAMGINNQEELWQWG